MKLTGAQALIKSLEMEGDGGHVRPPRRGDPARLRPADRLVDPPHPRAPRAGRRPHGRGLRPRHRPPRRGHGHERPGRHQHRHAAVRRLHGLDPARGHHRPGAVRGDRHRRVPGVRHRRHHDAGHQAQLARHRRRRTSRASSARRSTSRPRAARARCSSTCPKDVANQTMDWYWPETVDLPGYKPNVKGHPKQIKDAARLMGEAQRPVIYAGGGILKAARGRGAARARRAHRHPGGHHADGAGRVPRRPPAVPRHAGHARQLHRGHVDAEVRPARSRSGSRFDDRVTGKLDGVRAGRQDHPRRHRPRRARQGAPARRADRRRLPRSSSRSW